MFDNQLDDELAFMLDNNSQKSLSRLPIYKKLPEIVDGIKKSMITIIKSDTDTDKTIGIPNYLSREKQFYNSIFCATPTVTAAISASNYQSEIVGIRNYVGYGCDTNNNYYPTTKIVYCTSRHLLNKMIRTVSNIIKHVKQTYWFCSVLVLDEFHVRSKENDLCLCLWSMAYKAWKNNPEYHPKPPKLVIMTASPTETIRHLLPTEPSIFTYTSQTTHPVKIIYDEQSSNRNYNIDDDDLYLRAVTVAKRYHNEKYNGVYLIFVPGKPELELVSNELEKIFGSSAEVYSAHSDLTSDELNAIYNQPKPGVRKIIVATSVAEYSITIEGVSLVIDTMTHRETSSGLDESLKLDLHWISKVNSKQRMGKTGRTCPGIYVALMSATKYSTLADTVTPELDRVSISYDILKLMKYDLDPKNILAPVMNGWQIDIHIELLKKLGFIREPDKNKFVSQILANDTTTIVTDMVDFCSEFPLSIRKSAMLYHLKNNNEQNVFIYLATICTLNCYGSGLYYSPKKNKGEDHLTYDARRLAAKQIFDTKFAGYSDVDTIFNIWIEMCSAINPFYITDLRAYCRENQLCFRRFKETVVLLKQCVIISNRLGLRAYHNVRTFERPRAEDLGKTFYHLLSLTHQDYVTTVHYNFTGDVTALCSSLQHKIDNRSIHLMELGNNMRQVYYSLVRTQRTTKKGHVLRIINVLHTIPQDDIDEDTPSIFSSDIDSDPDSELSVAIGIEPLTRSSSQPILIKGTNKERWAHFLAMNECEADSNSDGSIPSSPSDDREIVCGSYAFSLSQ